MPGEKKLRITATAEGFEKVASKIDRVTEAEGRLAQQTEESGKVSETVAKQRRKLDDALGTVGSITVVFTKLALVIRKTFFALRLFASIGAILSAMRAIRQAVKEEIAERERLIAVMKIQGAVQDELKNRAQKQKDVLERIAGRRREGGFGTADIARGVQAGAARAAEQFTQLEPQDINLAFGTFGDIEGLSQKNLTDLAAVASFGQLKPEEGMDPAALKRYADYLLKRFRERIDKFARVETVQGQGLGRPEFAPAGPTEQAQAAAEEMRTPDGGAAVFAKRLAALMSAGADLEQALMLAKRFGSAEELEKHVLGLGGRAFGVEGATTLNPFRTLSKSLKAVPEVEIALPDQPGFVNQLLDRLGLTKEYVTLKKSEYEELLRALRQIEKEGLFGRERAGGELDKPVDGLGNAANELKEAAEALRGAAAAVGRAEGPAGETGAIYNFQNAKFVGPDARSQARQIRNGESRLRRLGW